MAVVQNPLIGKARGSVGNTTFATWKGLSVLKAKAFNVNQPNTSYQLGYRAAFSRAVYIGKRMLPAILRGFPEYQKGTTEFASYMHYNLTQDTLGNRPIDPQFNPPYDPVMNWNIFQCSHGSIDNATSPFVSDNNVGSFTVSWTDNANGSTALETDQPTTVLINNTTFLPYFITEPATRQDGAQIKSLPVGFVGETFQVFLFFTRFKQLKGIGSVFSTIPWKASMSVPLGPVTIV